MKTRFNVFYSCDKLFTYMLSLAAVFYWLYHSSSIRQVYPKSEMRG